MSLFDMMDEAMALELGVDLQTYINIIEDECSDEEADFIVTNIWQEDGDIEAAKKLFNSKL